MHDDYAGLCADHLQQTQSICTQLAIMSRSCMLLLAVALAATAGSVSARSDAILQRPSQIVAPRPHSVVDEVVAALQARFLCVSLDIQLPSGGLQGPIDMQGSELWFDRQINLHQIMRPPGTSPAELSIDVGSVARMTKHSMICGDQAIQLWANTEEQQHSAHTRNPALCRAGSAAPRRSHPPTPARSRSVTRMTSTS